MIGCRGCQAAIRGEAPRPHNERYRAEKEKKMQEKEQEISKLSASVSAKEQKINELSAEMSAALDTKNAELDRALSETGEANKKIGGLQKTMQDKEQEIS